MKILRSELEAYLKQLINNLLYLKSLNDQLTIIKKWETPKGISTLNHGAFFISLVVVSFHKTILIELYKLFGVNEDKTINDFLKKLKLGIKDVSPTRYSHETNKREQINHGLYRECISRQERLIHSKSDVMANIKSLRDKTTHADKDFFNKPSDIYKKYPIDSEEITEMISVATKVLRFHHLYLCESDLDITVHSSSNIDSLLIYARAFDRIWHDDRLNGINKFKYKLDDYIS